MKGYVIAIIVGLVLGVIRICVKTKLFHRDAYEKTFVCPNCGVRFNVEWYRMIFKANEVYTLNGAHLKCPVCHKKDLCSVAYNEQ